MKKCISDFFANLMDRIDKKEFTAREILLTGALLLLSGFLLGLFLSPKKYSVIGSNNGNNNGNDSGNNNGCCDANAIDETVEKTIHDAFVCED
ncbi:MAG: hypothetical protein PUD20_01000 [bacterium]|nr:hypothetical protein [bacterium]